MNPLKKSNTHLFPANRPCRAMTRAGTRCLNWSMTGGNVKAVCSWIGNIPEVAMQHYAQVTEADIKEAAKMSLLSDAQNIVQNTVHNPVQKVVEGGCKPSQEITSENDVSTDNCETYQ
ncbi:MAG: hypothetical protein P8016_15830 [Sedimentisphaerales bacterium]